MTALVSWRAGISTDTGECVHTLSPRKRSSSVWFESLRGQHFYVAGVYQ